MLVIRKPAGVEEMTIIIAAIIGLGIGIYNAYNYSWGDLVEYILNSFFGIIIGGTVGVIIAIALPMDTYNKQYSLKIESLQDANNIRGNFFLGIGQVEGKMQYVFYYKSGEFYRMAQIEYELVKIKYSNAEPQVHITEKYPTEAFINNFAYDTDIHSKTYIIEVPQGTIKNNYNLDAQ